MHRVIFVKLELGGQEIVKNSEDPFFFFSPKLKKILQLPWKISEDLFSFYFFIPNSKKMVPGGLNYYESFVDH